MEEIVGQRIRTRLQELGMTHAAFGEALAPYLGKAWSRSTVSVALNGGRQFTAAETLASSLVLRVTPGSLLTPPMDAETIEFPSGLQIPRAKMIAEIAPLAAGASEALQLAREGSQSVVDQLIQIEAVMMGTAGGLPTYSIPDAGRTEPVEVRVQQPGDGDE